MLFVPASTNVPVIASRLLPAAVSVSLLLATGTAHTETIDPPFWAPVYLSDAVDLGHEPTRITGAELSPAGPVMLSNVATAAGLGAAHGGGNSHGVGVAFIDIDGDTSLADADSDSPKASASAHTRAGVEKMSCVMVITP